MTGDRLTGSEKRALLLWVAAGIFGLLFAHKYFFQAFPEASVNFQVSRGEALTRAQKFVTGLGENVSGYKSSIIFDVDDDACSANGIPECTKLYLEREVGLREANRLMSSELNIWYWDVRFFKPLQEEEFEVRVSPSGQIVGYNHKIPEARAGASLDRTTAQSVAENFLKSKLGMDLRGWDPRPDESNSKKEPNRTDWTFTLEKHGFRAKDAPDLLQVTVQGDRIGRTKEILKVPDAWQRSYLRLRSSNDTLALAFLVLYIALLVVAVWFGIKLTLQGQTRWRGAILLGLLVAALLFLQGLNEWPLWSASYDTKASYGTFLAGKLGGALLLAVLSALTITIVLPGAEPLYRSSSPERLRLSKTFTLRGLRSKEFFSAAVVGLSLAAVHIGYVVGFYVVANWLGAWAPQEVNYQESVNTLFPWISGAAIGLLASTNEEFTFRLFAIPFFHRFTKSKWIAVIVPAFMWSFLHSNYPQEPAYTRGIEIGLIGIVAGIVMLRWGILATLIWHYTVDASLVGLFLLRSNSVYFKVSGAIVAAAAFAPLVFACLSYLARGGFETDEDLRNSATPAPNLDLAIARPSASVSGTRRYDPLAQGMIALLAVCLVAGGLITWRLKPESIGEYLKLSVDVKSARVMANETLRARGVDPSSYKCAVIFADIVDPVTNEFLRQRVGIARANEIYDKQVPGALWQARYFRDNQPEEYAVKLRPDGALFAVQHKMAENTVGASLKKEEAVARAEKYLREEKKMDLRQWTLVESDSETRPHRVDHLLTWQQNTPIDSTSSASATSSGHAYVRVRVAVLGDQVTDYRRSYFRRSGSADKDEPASEGFSTFIKIPDDWRRRQEEATLPREALTFGIPIVLFGGLGLTALIIFLKNLRSDAVRVVPWKRLSLWAAWGFISFYVFFFLGDEIPNWMNSYNTAIPLKTMFGIIGIRALLSGPLSFGFLVLLFGVAWYYAKLTFGDERLPGWAGMAGKYYRDALWIGLGGSAALLGLERFLETASTHWHTVHRYLDVSFGQDFDAILPAASIIGGTLLDSLRMVGFVVVIASFIAAKVRQAWLRVFLFFVGALAVVGGSWGSPADFAKQFLARLILIGVLVFGVRYVMRFNLLGCFLVVAGTSLFSGASELLTQPNGFYRTNGYAVLVALVLLFVWPIIAWRLTSMNGVAPSVGREGRA